MILVRLNSWADLVTPSEDVAGPRDGVSAGVPSA
jgi:hypothetical protein